MTKFDLDTLLPLYKRILDHWWKASNIDTNRKKLWKNRAMKRSMTNHLVGYSENYLGWNEEKYSLEDPLVIIIENPILIVE